MRERRVEVQERQRLDVLLARLWPDLGRHEVEEMVRQQQVLVNGHPALKPGQYVEVGDVVEAQAPAAGEDEETSALPTTLPMQVLYEDDVLLVVEKPAGMPTHARWWEQGSTTLSEQLRERYPALANVGGINRAGILQRLEKDVSGLMLVAQEREIYREMKHEVKRGRVHHTYFALVEGHLEGNDVIDAPIGDAKYSRHRMTVAREGRPARTKYSALSHYSSENRPYTLLKVEPDSSRMHQMRVHLSWYGYPIVGDTVYGSSRQWLLSDRLFLHLAILTFHHPLTREQMEVQSELPEALSSILKYMKRPGYLR
ncbi:MAG: RluA family pseudouridine synthase [Anaerolineae bacterium]